MVVQIEIRIKELSEIIDMKESIILSVKKKYKDLINENLITEWEERFKLLEKNKKEILLNKAEDIYKKRNLLPIDEIKEIIIMKDILPKLLLEYGLFLREKAIG